MRRQRTGTFTLTRRRTHTSRRNTQKTMIIERSVSRIAVLFCCFVRFGGVIIAAIVAFEILN